MLIDLSNIIQIGIVVNDIKKAADKIQNSFGIGPFEIVEPDHWNKRYMNGPGHFRVLISNLKSGNVFVELIQPLEGENIYTEFLRTKGEGLHHLGIEVDDLDKAVEELDKIGINVLQSGEGKRAKYAYLDSETTFGIIFELIEWRK